MLLRRIGRNKEAENIFDAGKAVASWRTSWQMPSIFNTSMRSQPWWPVDAFPAAVAMREKAGEIRAELDALLAKGASGDFSLEGDYDLVSSPNGWTEFKLMDSGKWDEKRCYFNPISTRLMLL